MNKEIYGVVYLIRNNVNNKVYIGQTSEKGGFDRRYKHNLRDYTHNTHLRNSIDKYGIENFYTDKEFDIAYSQEELDKLEDMYIKMYEATNPKKGYNKTFGGGNGKASEETRKKISETLKSKYANGEMISWNKGKKCPELAHEYTEEAKRHLSEVRKEWWENNPNYKLSQETKNKMSESAKKSWDEERRKEQSLKTKEQHQDKNFKNLISLNFKNRWNDEKERQRLCNSMKKSYLLVNVINNSYIEFLGREDLAKYIGKSVPYMKKYMSKGLLHENKYLIIKKEDYINQ